MLNIWQISKSIVVDRYQMAVLDVEHCQGGMSQGKEKRFFNLLDRISSQTEISQILKVEVVGLDRRVDSGQSQIVFFQDEMSQRSDAF